MNDDCPTCLAMAQWERELSSYRAAATQKEKLRCADSALTAAGKIITAITVREGEPA